MRRHPVPNSGKDLQIPRHPTTALSYSTSNCHNTSLDLRKFLAQSSGEPGNHFLLFQLIKNFYWKYTASGFSGRVVSGGKEPAGSVFCDNSRGVPDQPPQDTSHEYIHGHLQGSFTHHVGSWCSMYLESGRHKSLSMAVVSPSCRNRNVRSLRRFTSVS